MNNDRWFYKMEGIMIISRALKLIQIMKEGYMTFKNLQGITFSLKPSYRKEHYIKEFWMIVILRSKKKMAPKAKWGDWIKKECFFFIIIFYNKNRDVDGSLVFWGECRWLSACSMSKETQGKKKSKGSLAHALISHSPNNFSPDKNFCGAVVDYYKGSLLKKAS